MSDTFGRGACLPVERFCEFRRMRGARRGRAANKYCVKGDRERAACCASQGGWGQSPLVAPSALALVQRHGVKVMARALGKFLESGATNCPPSADVVSRGTRRIRGAVELGGQHFPRKYHGPSAKRQG